MMDFISKNKDVLLDLVNSLFGFLRKIFKIERDPEYAEFRSRM